MKRILIAICFALTCCFAAHAQTAVCSGNLATVAACLTPGQWGEVTGMTNFLSVSGSLSILDEIPAPSFYGGSGTDTLLSFMDKMKWNPQTHELYIYGGAHNSSCPCEKWAVKFNADTNAWAYLTMPPDATRASTWGTNGYLQNGGGQHYYDYSALDTVNQIFYIHDASISAPGGTPGEFRSMAYDIKSSTWTTLPHNFAQNAFGEGTLESQEYFPDLQKLVYTNSSAYIIGGVSYGAATQYQTNNGLNQWEYFNGSTFANPPSPGTQGFKLPMGVTYPISRYDNQHHVLYFGGGTLDGGVTTATNQVYKYEIYNGTTCNPTPDSGLTFDTGCTTALPTTGAPSIISSQSGMSEIDPVTGDLVILIDNGGTGPTSLMKYVYHNGASSWTSSNIGPVSGHSILYSGDPAYPMYAEVTASITDDSTYQGVILILQYLGVNNAHLWVYKNAQRPSFTSKCAATGVLNCWQFDSKTNIDTRGATLTYNWDSGNGALNSDSIIAAYVAAGGTNLGITGWRDNGEALSKAYNMFSTPAPSLNSVAQIDTSVKFDGAGSLKIPMQQYNIEETAYFGDNLDGRLGHPNVAICKNLTNCPLGNVIWTQVMARFSDSMISDFIFECSLQIGGNCYNGGAGQALQVNSGFSTTADKTLNCSGCSPGYTTGFCIAISNPGDCIGSHVGKQLYMYGGTNCVQGPYTIAAVNSYSQIVLNASPSTVGAQCSGSTLMVEHLSNTSGGAQPWKFVLMVTNALPLGSPPNGSPGGNCECNGEVMTSSNQSYPHGPQVYDRKGTNSPAVQLNYRFLANTWMEITEEIIVGDDNVANTEVKWWVDGNLVYDWTGGILELDGGDDGYGIGQIQLETYTTHRDGFFAAPAGASPTWYDDVITSTQPIAFNNGGGGSPAPPSGTAGRLRVKKP